MTNEELAVLIQEGDKEYIEELWERVRRIIYIYCYRYYNANAGRCASCGIEKDDLIQEGFFAMLEAVKAYKPESGYKFASFLRYPLKKAFNSLTGLRTAAQTQLPLNHALNIDKPLEGAENMRLVDTIPDEAATESMDNVEKKLYISQLRHDIEKGLEKLPENERKAIRGIYLEGISGTKAAADEGLKPQSIYCRVKSGFTKLRKDPTLMKYRDDIISRYGHKSSFSRWKHSGYSSTEYTALRLIMGRRLDD